jgi:small subunit ribosomal protein S6
LLKYNSVRVNLYLLLAWKQAARPEGGKNMRKYEIMYILNASTEEAVRTETIETLHKIITDADGTIEKVDEWGMREFAYPIEDMTKGYYVVVTINANNDAIVEFDRISRINANVVRHMIVKID